jgi:putative addiction module component (TIGR02574 family)
MPRDLPIPPPGFDELSVDEKVDYVQSLWDRLAAHPDEIPVSDWHQQVIDEHLAAHRDSPDAARSWEVVRKAMTQVRSEYAKYTSTREFIQRALESCQAEGELSELAAEWKRTRQRASSSIVKLAMPPAYQRIIGKGPSAIPFILRELQKAPDHWFWALAAMTGEDPVSEDDRGDLEAMAHAWIEWGKKSGYL